MWTLLIAVSVAFATPPASSEGAPSSVEATVPTELKLAGCPSRPGTETPGVLRLECQEGTILAVDLPAAPLDLEAARAALQPLLKVEGGPYLPDGAPRTVQVGGLSLSALPLADPSTRVLIFTDPTAVHPRAMGCLDRSTMDRDAWCRVQLETLWGPTASGEPTRAAPKP